MRAVLAHDLGGGRHAGAVHQAEEGAQFLGRGHGLLAVGFLGDVAVHVALAQFLGQGLARLVLDVGDDDLGAVFRQHAHGARAQSGSATRNNEYLVRDFHVSTTRSIQGIKAARLAPNIKTERPPGRDRNASRPAGAEGRLAIETPYQLLTASNRRDLISSTAPTPEILRYLGAPAGSFWAQDE